MESNKNESWVNIVPDKFNTMESKHTKGKWITGEIYPCNIFIDKLPGSNIIVECHSVCLNNNDEVSHFITDEEAEANAAYIVKCVNAHDELVKALQDVKNYLTSLANSSSTPKRICSDIYSFMTNIQLPETLKKLTDTTPIEV